MSRTAQKLTVFRAFLVVLKWTLVGAVPLAGLYYVVEHVAKPVREEIARPKGTPTVVDKNASVLVQAVQQTRLTVEKHDRNVAEVNDLAGAAEPAEAAEGAVAANGVTAPRVRSTAGLSREEAAVEMLKVGAVIAGPPPRLMLGGKLVRLGDVVHEDFGLRFSGLDAAARVVLFVNAKGRVFRRSY